MKKCLMIVLIIARLPPMAISDANVPGFKDFYLSHIKVINDTLFQPEDPEPSPGSSFREGYLARPVPCHLLHVNCR